MNRTRTISAIATTSTLLVGGVLLAPSASAATYSCTASGANGGLHAAGARTNYSDGSSILGYATARYVEPIAGPDIEWTFVKFTSSTGLQTRTSNPTTWGGSAGNRLPKTTESITAQWTGYNYGAAVRLYRVCTVTVGVS